jgi:prepilin-type N-terminal cleavage/methylation domain-containing protein
MKLLMLTRRTAAFTIVELLIVIVVISILAAITIVGYNGIQTRAENTKTINAVGAYARALQSYAAINGGYPVTGVSVFACFGAPVGGECGNTTDAVAGACGGNSVAGATNAAFDTAIRTVLTSLPSPSSQNITCGTRVYSGAHYSATSSSVGYVTYYLRGDQTCGGIGGLESFGKNYTADLTVCGAQLPTLP